MARGFSNRQKDIARMIRARKAPVLTQSQGKGLQGQKTGHIMSEVTGHKIGGMRSAKV